MGVFGRLATKLGRRKAGAVNGGVPYRQVRMDAASGEDGDGVALQRPDEPSPRSRQELLQELQKNYNEVIELVRKVDGHLDRESERSVRMLELAERIPEAIDLLAETRGQNERIIEAVREATEAAKSSDSKMESALDLVHDRLDESRESDAQLVGTMAEFRGSLREMADASAQSGRAIASMNERNAQRDADLAEIMTVTRRWIVAALLLGALGVAAAMVSVVLFVIQTPA